MNNQECTNVTDGNKCYNETLNVTLLNAIQSDDCASCTLYLVLYGVFVYFYWYSKKDIAQKYLKNNVSVKLNPFKKKKLLKRN